MRTGRYDRFAVFEAVPRHLRLDAIAQAAPERRGRPTASAARLPVTSGGAGAFSWRSSARRPEDGAGSGHGAPDAGPIVATMNDDGTLAGELSTTRGRTKWTGERLKKP